MSTKRPTSGQHSNPLSQAASQSAKRAIEGYLPHGASRPAKVLCLESDARSRRRLADAGAGLKITVEAAQSADEFSGAFAGGEYDVVVLSLDRDPQGAVRIAGEIIEAELPVSILFSTRKPTLEHGVLAMRCGAVDLLTKPFDPQELRERLASGAERAQRLRQQERRIERLKRICRRLNQQRQQVNSKVDVLCGDLMSAYQQLADQVAPAPTDKLSASIEAELDVEALLRKTLEHMLTRTGPTNAAVFLPGNSGDYSLGAYVNYDLPRETADTLLDHLADILPHRFDSGRSLVLLDSEEALTSVFGDEASWLTGSSLIATPCHSEDDDCLAVIAIFRDNSEPFTPDILREVSTLRDGFSRQLAKVVRVHNRATPKAEWLGFDIGDETDEDDTAGDWGKAA